VILDGLIVSIVGTNLALLSENTNFKIQSNVSLSRLTTFRLGGPCRGLILCQTPSQLKDVVRYFAQENLPFIVMGGGSNLIVSDQGLDCYVIRYLNDVPSIEIIGNDILVTGSTNLDALALFAAEQGLEGINYLSGIPGTVGGAVVGNAGAFGKQIGDVLQTATLLTKSGVEKEALPQELGFAYRHSDLKKTGDLVMTVRLALKSGDHDTLLKEREDILKIRHEKHPDLKKEPCAGSFFRNIEPTSKAGKRQASGWFLEEAGAKALRVGGAYIFPKHANIIIKGKNCKSQDVFELHKKMYEVVKQKFGLELVREVLFVGKFSGMPAGIKTIMW